MKHKGLNGTKTPRIIASETFNSQKHLDFIVLNFCDDSTSVFLYPKVPLVP